MSGYAFGKGLYLVSIAAIQLRWTTKKLTSVQADISSKSANYCHSEASGNTGLLLLCEVELGKPMLELGLGQYDAPEVAKGLGFFSCMGKGATTPLYWRDASCVNPNLAGVMMVGRHVYTTHESNAGLAPVSLASKDAADFSLQPNVEGKRGSIGPGPHTDFFLQYNVSSALPSIPSCSSKIDTQIGIHRLRCRSSQDPLPFSRGHDEDMTGDW